MKKQPKRFEVLENAIRPKWKGKKGVVNMSEMDNNYLQSAKFYAQTQLLHYHNKMNIFETLIENLENEATSRGLQLKDLDEVKKTGKFFENKRLLNNKIKQLK